MISEKKSFFFFLDCNRNSTKMADNKEENKEEKKGAEEQEAEFQPSVNSIYSSYPCTQRK